MNENEGILNLVLIYEALKEKGIAVVFRESEKMRGLQGIRFWDRQMQLTKEALLFLCPRELGTELPLEGDLLLFGDWKEEEIATPAGYLKLPADCNVYWMINFLEELFAYYKKMETELSEILNGDSGVGDICRVGLRHFQMPIFVHDEYYYILACPKLVEGKTNFEYNAQVGNYMQDSDTIMMFQTSIAYQATLETRGAQYWDSDFNDEQCIYYNIFVEDTYKGRLIIVDPNMTPGKLRICNYLGNAITQAILNHYAGYNKEEEDTLHTLIVDILEGRDLNKNMLTEEIVARKWAMEDRYICGKINFISEKTSRLMVFGICNDIQSHIPGSYTCYYDNAIYMLVNMTKGNITVEDYRQEMSLILRESLLRIGVSNEFFNLLYLPDYLRQAEITLAYASDAGGAIWYNQFRDKALRHWLTRGFGQLSPRGIIPGELELLRRYDRENTTDLYETLKMYLLCERKSVLTSQMLKIHRSTLPYRLERIEELTKLNLDDYRVRLYLQMAFAIEDQEIIP